MKKILLTLGSFVTAAAPVAAVVSCGAHKTDKAEDEVVLNIPSPEIFGIPSLRPKEELDKIAPPMMEQTIPILREDQEGAKDYIMSHILRPIPKWFKTYVIWDVVKQEYVWLPKYSGNSKDVVEFRSRYQYTIYKYNVLWKQYYNSKTIGQAMRNKNIFDMIYDTSIKAVVPV